MNEWVLKKLDPNAVLTLPEKSDKKADNNLIMSQSKKAKLIQEILTAGYTLPRDTMQKPARSRPKLPLSAEKESHISQRILLIGDSETGGLIYPLNDYCVANGHKLEAVYTWFSASILNFGYSNKVDELIEKLKNEAKVI